MRICLSFFSYPLIVHLLVPSLGYGQTAEYHSVEHLEPSEVGTYDPTKKPDLNEVEQQIVERTNAFRKEQDRESVKVDQTLTQTANEFAQFMARTDKYGHHADGRSPSERAKSQGYEMCMISENIAYQFKTTGFATEELAKAFVTGWKNSPGHRKNMLEKHVTETGVGVAQSESTGVFYAVQMSGRPKSQQIEFRLVNKTDVDFNYRVAERQYSLPPRYSRRHMLCQPAQLSWLPELKAGSSEESKTQQDARSLKPQDGEEYRVERQGDKILVQPVEMKTLEMK